MQWRGRALRAVAFMTFQDPVLRQHYEHAIALMSGLPVELHPICALMDAYQLYRQTEGEPTPRVREIIYHLTDPDLRPSLRQWFRIMCDNEMNPTAMKLRKQMSEIIGESL